MYREYQIGRRRLKIFLGDITDLQVDAIVNSENNDLIMDSPNGPSVSAAIRRRSDPMFADHVAHLGPIELGKAVLTPATGSLSCKFVIHAAVVQKLDADTHQTEPTALRSAVRSSLQVASASGLKVVAFPAFGVRAAEVPREVSSDLMIQEVVDFLHHDSSLEEVIFALLDPEAFLVFFERAIMRYVEYSAPIELSAHGQAPHIEMRLNAGGPVSTKANVPVRDDLLHDVASRFQVLQDAAQRQHIDAPGRLRSFGAFLWNFVLPGDIRDELSQVNGANLILKLDENLTGLPLELAWDGHSFLAEKFRVGRHVSINQTSQRRSSSGPVASKSPRYLLYCDPESNLPGAHSEGIRLFTELCQQGLDVRLRGGRRATLPNLLSLLPETNILHYCGHGVVTESGQQAWQLADEKLYPSHFESLTSRLSLVFSNACGRDQHSIVGADRLALGRAFLGLGTRHFVGTLWDVGDQLASEFSSTFYDVLLADGDIGDALRTARAAIRTRGGRGSIDWASYIHFGDPRENPLLK